MALYKGFNAKNAQHLNIYNVFAILKWYKLGLRKDFSAHKRKTVESFALVRADISAISASIEQLKNRLSFIESETSMANSSISGLRNSIDKCSFSIKAQQSSSFNLQSKIEHIDKSIANAIATISSLNKSLDSVLSKYQKISERVLSHDNAIKRLFSESKMQALKNKRINSALRKSKEKAKKLEAKIKSKR